MSKLISVLDVTQLIPEPPNNELPRENILDVVDSHFKAGTRLVVLEGEQGIGKTTTLLQFALRHRRRSLCTFINPMARWSSNMQTVASDLANQIHYFIHGKEYSDDESPNLGDLLSLLPKLQRKIRKESEPVYFVIDGLLSEQETNNILSEDLLRILPFANTGNIYFLFSGNVELLPEHLKSFAFCKPFSLPRLTLGETRRFLEKAEIEEAEVSKIFKVTSGNPAKIEQYRRIILTSGLEFDELPTASDELFEIEWRHTLDCNSSAELLMAFLSKHRDAFSIRICGIVLGVEESDIRKIGEESTITVIDETADKIAITSLSVAKKVSDKTHSLQKEVTDKLIDALISDPSSDETMSKLPKILSDSSKNEQLLSVIDNNFLISAARRTGSWSDMVSNATYALNAAIATDQDAEIVQYSVNQTTITQVRDYKSWTSEVKALLACDMVDDAISVSTSALGTEDKLMKLSVIGRWLKESNRIVPPEISDQIRSLCKRTNFSEMSEELREEIATDVLYTDPEIAISIIEQGKKKEDQGSTDFAYAKLSVEAAVSNRGKSDRGEAEKLTSARIEDQGIASFASGIQILLKSIDTDAIIREVQNIHDESIKIVLLRKWCKTNQKASKAHEVMQYGLDQVFRSVEAFPGVETIHDLSSPLAHIEDIDLAKKLIGILDAQAETIDSSGSSLDIVRLQALIFEAEWKFNQNLAIGRLEEVYLRTDDISQIDTKFEIKCIMLSVIARVDDQLSLENTKDRWHSLLETEIGEVFELLLCESANHYESIIGGVSVLVKFRFDLALEYCSRMNSSPRRDRARLRLSKILCSQDQKKITAPEIQAIINSIEDRAWIDAVLMELFRSLKQEGKIEAERLTEYMPVLQRCREITAAQQRAHCKAIFLSLLCQEGISDSIAEPTRSELMTEIESVAEECGRLWEQTEAAFLVVESLAKIDKESAIRVLNTARSGVLSRGLAHPDHAMTCIICVRLSIRAFSGLIKKRVFTEDQLSAIRALIVRIPSPIDRALLYSELALHLFGNGCDDEARSITFSDILPVIEHDSKQDMALFNSAMISIAPTLYMAEKSKAFEIFDSLDWATRNEAYDSCANYLVCRTIHDDPCEVTAGHSFGRNLDYGRILEVLDIISNLECDSDIYRSLDALTNSIESREFKKRITRVQRADIIEKMERLVASVFPKPKYILHGGYEIVSTAKIFSLKRVSTQTWRDLVDRVTDIHNISDRVYIYTEIATSMPSKERSFREEVVGIAISQIDALTCDLERINRLMDMATLVSTFNLSLTKELLTRAMQESLSGGRGMGRQRRIIDLACKYVDDTFGEVLAELLEDDPARLGHRQAARERIGEEKALAALVAGNAPPTSTNWKEEVKIAWRMLGDLNSGRTGTMHLSQTRPMIPSSRMLDLSDAYPIYAWFIQNAVVRHQESPEADQLLRPIFEAMLLSAELSFRLGDQSDHELYSLAGSKKSDEESDFVVLEGSDRAKAVDFITEWVKSAQPSKIWIVDPYFGISELEVIAELKREAPGCEVRILTSKKPIEKEIGGSAEIKEALKTQWKSVSVGIDGGGVRIVLANCENSGKFPVHDRWWYCESSGLEFGTSANTIGEGRASKIRRMNRLEVEAIEDSVGGYFDMSVCTFENENIDYELFMV